MGKILTVHGTFAHIEVPGGSDESDATAAYWWRVDSPFVADLKKQLRGKSGDEVEVTPFVWSGNNSERERRDAGHQLFLELKRLEQAGETYGIIAHSHGGSVVSAALLEAAAKKEKLAGLKRWITIGTPFIELRRERFLFMRLPILLKAMYVASLMLFFMFAVAVALNLISGDFDPTRMRHVYWFLSGGVLMSLPAVVFFLIAWVRERRQRYFYRPSVKARAKSYFADRWVALTHEDDEAVRGLGALRDIAVPIFSRSFAVPVLSVMAAFMLPVLYLVAIFSPTFMVKVADTLRTDVYQVDEVRARAERYEQSRRSVRGIRRQLRTARRQIQDPVNPFEKQEAARSDLRAKRQELRSARDRMRQMFPDMPQLRRAAKFQRIFLERDGVACGGLCDRGTNAALNARLLLHLATDEVASLVVDEELQYGLVGRFARYLAPVLLVPIVFGFFAVIWVLVVQYLAQFVSRYASRYLDKITWAQLRRAATGNDMLEEVAVGTAVYPRWIGARRPFLPMEVGAEITHCSNEATFRSVGKFRNALSELVLMDRQTSESDSLLAYLTWNELIHTSYFCVPAFTALVAGSLARSDGFELAGQASAAVTREDLSRWLEALNEGAQSTPQPAAVAA